MTIKLGTNLSIEENHFIGFSFSCCVWFYPGSLDSDFWSSRHCQVWVPSGGLGLKLNRHQPLQQVLCDHCGAYILLWKEFQDNLHERILEEQ